MASESIFLEFLLLLTLLFFVPRVFHKWIPHPITEVLLGIAVSLFATQFFEQEALIAIPATLGIITLFVYAGLEADTEFMLKHKRIFLENIALFFLTFLLIGILIKLFSGWSLQVSLLISLALITPSASFILAVTKDMNTKQRSWVEGKALAAEITSIALMAVLLSIDDVSKLALSLVVVAVLLLVVPLLLTFLYKHLFSKLIGTEFSFILVIALFSAYITELIGMHFLVGAFFAGLVSQRFIVTLQKDARYRNITKKRAGEIVEAFGFFAVTFAPFYFFSAGLQISKDMLDWRILLAAVLLFVVISTIRLLPVVWHRYLRVDEKQSASWRISAMLLPTLVFTFVLASILYRSFGVSTAVFGTLMIYGILASLLPVILVRAFERKRQQSL